MPSDYQRIADAIAFLDERAAARPSLDDLARHLGLSPFHVQRLFSRWAGISPKRFLEVLTVEHAHAALDRGATVLDASLAAGLSGPGRLHDHFVSLEAVTPGEARSQGEGLLVRTGVHDSPFGPMLIGVTERGVCGLHFGDDPAPLRATWPRARFVEDPSTRETAERIFSSDARRLNLLVRGTNFQVQVWRALLRIPEGAVVSYEAVAAAIGRPTASRAVGQAIARNPVGYLVPCHRVIRKVGGMGAYRWGAERKRAMLAWEAAQKRQPAAPSSL